MIVINGFPINDDGRVALTEAFVNAADHYFEGRRFRSTDGALRSVINNAPTVFLGGFGFTAFDQLCVVDALTPIASRHSGLTFDAQGNLRVTLLEDIDHHVSGWPVSATGALCISPDTQPASDAFTDGFTTGFN